MTGAGRPIVTRAGFSAVPGAAMFARFAYPPNALGYCGPDHSELLLQHAATGRLPTATVTRLARRFEGVWPYLELLADAAGCDDPLAEKVVEAYWIGNGLLGQARHEGRNRDLDGLGRRAWDGLGRRAWDGLGRRAWDGLGRAETATESGAFMSHAFHVFEAYPWVAMLHAGRGGPEPLRIVDRCRIRWGTVSAVDGDYAEIESQPLAAAESKIALAEPVSERARIAAGGLSLVEGLRVGDTVALHWDWVCQRLDPAQLAWLRSVTTHELARVSRFANSGETMNL